MKPITEEQGHENTWAMTSVWMKKMIASLDSQIPNYLIIDIRWGNWWMKWWSAVSTMTWEYHIFSIRQYLSYDAALAFKSLNAKQIVTTMWDIYR